MIKKHITCNEITFESLNDILKYKKTPIDVSWKLTKECIDNIKNIYKELYEYKETMMKKYGADEIEKQANDILIGLDKICEDNKICQDALKMNSLMQSETLKTDMIDDVEDEAEEILKREAPEKLCEPSELDVEGEKQLDVGFDFECEGKAKPDELERLNNLNKNNTNCKDFINEY